MEMKAKGMEQGDENGWNTEIPSCSANFHLKDSTFEFERKCNRPKRYDRNVTDNTLKAIKKIDKISVYREERYCKEDERKESQGLERSSEGARAEHSLSRSSCCTQQRAITYTACQGPGYTKAVEENRMEE
ncbi:putative ribosome biogenesis protein RLP24 [Capsicum chinense]|nr:putative ribosome biogenesis protein RLP24 [Capsicum chinense]